MKPAPMFIKTPSSAGLRRASPAPEASASRPEDLALAPDAPRCTSTLCADAVAMLRAKKANRETENESFFIALPGVCRPYECGRGAPPRGFRPIRQKTTCNKNVFCYSGIALELNQPRELFMDIAEPGILSRDEMESRRLLAAQDLQTGLSQ